MRGVYRATAANLRVTALTLTPVNSGPGATVSAVATVKNVGSGAAPATTARFYYSSDNVLDAADVEIGSRPVPALASGAEDATPVDIVLPANAAVGSAFVIALADATNEVLESSETDNTRSTSVKVGADLRVSSMSVPASAGAGATINVSVTTQNQGGSEAPATVTRLYLSTDTTVDGADTPLGDRAVPVLGPSTTDVAIVPVTLPATLADGTYYIVAQADATALVTEVLETNNETNRAFVVGTDFVVSALTVPSTAGPGETIGVTDTTRFNGGSPAPATRTTFHLSTDNKLDAADVPLGARDVPALEGNTASTGTTQLTIPTDTAAGAYFVIARADADNALAESDEGNNTLAKPIGIGADLVVTNLNAPTSAAVGATIGVTDSTRNTTGSSAGPSTTSFYLSADAVLDDGDAWLGSRPVPGLAVGVTDTVTTQITLPAGLAGSFFLIAKADATGAVAERIEDNNTASRAIAIGADLVVTALTATSSTGGVTITDTVTNVGGEAAGTFVTEYYYSTDAVLGAGDTLLGNRRISGLAGGAASTDTISLPLPAGTPGSGFIIARADGEEVVLEIVETNNTASAAFAAGADLRITKLSVTPTKNITAGTVLTVTDTVQNAGVSGAGATTTRLYFSADAVLDAGDLPLGNRDVPALAARATNKGSTAVTVPAGTLAGRYYVLAVVDPDGTLPETIETNNLTSVRITVK